MSKENEGYYTFKHKRDTGDFVSLTVADLEDINDVVYQMVVFLEAVTYHPAGIARAFRDRADEIEESLK